MSRLEMVLASDFVEDVKTWSSAAFVCFVLALDYTPFR